MERERSQASARPQSVARPAASAASKVAGGGLLTTVLMVVLIIAAIVASIFFGSRLVGAAGSGAAVKSGQYQALFLTNGQVYFGKLKSVDSSYVRLTDIYYLQVQQTVQPKDNNAQNAQNQQVSLAKLGGELHGPEDTMYVSRDQVLFWENLKGDGKVAKAISDYKASGNSGEQK